MFFATLFDKNYISRGITLYKSLKDTCLDFKLFILALDDFTYDFIENLNFNDIILIRLTDLENFDSKLASIKKNRTVIEYYFTISPCLPLYILNKYKTKHICTLDADLYFYSSPEELFNKLNDHSVIITPHKFSQFHIGLEKYGLFNVSFQIFKNNNIAINCLEIWRNDCLNYCKDVVIENDNFADQKYLDKWPNLLKNELFILNDHLSGIAPWNIENYKLTYSNKIFLSSNEKVIFYHFHDFKIFNNHFFSDNLTKFGYKKNNLNLLYKDYFKENIYFLKKYNLQFNSSTRFVENKNVFLKLIKFQNVFFLFKNTILKLNFKLISHILKNKYV
jgi:hypothetical protein